MIVALVVLLSGCVEQQQSMEACKELKQEDRIECITDVAKSDKNASICDEIEDVHNRDFCITEVAQKTGETALCDKTSSIYEANGKWDCVRWVAYMNRNVALCEEIPTASRWRDQCFKDAVGIWPHDYTLCNKVIDMTERDWCLSYAGRLRSDISLCEQVNDSDLRNLCAAVVTKNPSLCEDLAYLSKENCILKSA